MAEIDYRTIEQFASSQFKSLPDYLSEDNADMFGNAFYLIDKLCELCADNPNTYRLIMPFHKLSFGLQSAYAHGFTWEVFLKEIIDASYTNVRKILNKSLSCIVFYNSSGEEGFSVELVHED